MPLLAYSQSQLLHHIHIHNPRVICDDENDQAARVSGCKEMEVIGERKKMSTLTTEMMTVVAKALKTRT